MWFVIAVEIERTISLDERDRFSQHRRLQEEVFHRRHDQEEKDLDGQS